METHQIKTLEEDELYKLQIDMTGVISRLPIDFIIDILSRLPTKSLSQCKMVSKSWYNLIHHPRFTLTQHTFAIQKNSPSLIHCDTKWNHYMIDHQSLTELKTLAPSYPILNQRQRVFYYTVVGSCNGLLCVRSEPHYFIINPVTGDHITLPVSNKYTSIDYFVCGFGVDPMTNAFKVVRVMSKKRRKLEAEVCTVGGPECSWREIPKVPYFTEAKMERHVTHNVFVAGGCHWLGWKPVENTGVRFENGLVRFDDGGFMPGNVGFLNENEGFVFRNRDPMVIVSFELSNEEFGNIGLPSSVQSRGDSECCHFYLGNLGECLCFIDGIDYMKQTDVWVMKEYGVQESWMKQFVITSKMLADPVGMVSSVGMVYSFMKLNDNDELLLLFNDKRLGYFDPNEGKFRPISIEGIDAVSTYVFPIAHVESLISPKDIARLKKSQ